MDRKKTFRLSCSILSDSFEDLRFLSFDRKGKLQMQKFPSSGLQLNALIEALHEVLHSPH